MSRLRARMSRLELLAYERRRRTQDWREPLQDVADWLKSLPEQENAEPLSPAWERWFTTTGDEQRAAFTEAMTEAAGNVPTAD